MHHSDERGTLLALALASKFWESIASPLIWRAMPSLRGFWELLARAKEPDLTVLIDYAIYFVAVSTRATKTT